MGGLVSAFAGSFTLSSKPSQVVIAPLDADGKIGDQRILQYWPESLDDNKSPNWQNMDFPGAPLPLYQWVSGGERTFGFSAIFSRDMKGEIGSSDGPEEDKWNVDVDAAIAWLRSLCHNDYGQVGDVKNAAIAPPVLWLYFMGTKLGYNRAATKATGNKDQDGVYCIMTECGASRTNWFSDGTTRFATVSLGFSEVIQVGQGIYPYGASGFTDLSSKYNRRPKK